VLSVRKGEVLGERIRNREKYLRRGEDKKEEKQLREMFS